MIQRCKLEAWIAPAALIDDRRVSYTFVWAISFTAMSHCVILKVHLFNSQSVQLKGCMETKYGYIHETGYVQWHNYRGSSDQ